MANFAGTTTGIIPLARGATNSAKNDALDIKVFNGSDLRVVGTTGAGSVTKSTVTNAENHTGRLAKSVNELYYSNVASIPSTLNAGSVLTDSEYSFSLFNNFIHETGATIQSITISDNTITLVGIEAPSQINRLSKTQYVLTIPGEGDDDIEFTITWVFANGATTVLTVIGVRTSIQTVVPDFPLIESMMFKSSITKTFTSETRGSLRVHPRMRADYNWLIQGSEFSRFYSTIRNGERTNLSFPLWMEARPGPPAVAGNSNVPYGFDTWDIQVNDAVFIQDYFGNDEVVTVLSRTNAHLVVSNFTQAHPKGYNAIPMITGFLRDAPLVSKGNMDTATVKLTLESTTFYKWGASDIGLFTGLGWELLSGRLVWPFPNFTFKPVEIGAFTDRTFNDNDSGLPYLVFSNDVKRDYYTLNYVMRSATEITLFKRFMYYLQGKVKGFYVPTDFADMVIATKQVDLGSVIITVDKLNGTEGYAGETKGIQFQFTDGTIHNAIATFTDGSQDVSFLPALGRSINVETDITRVCFLQYVRLNTDDITIEHTGPLRSTASLPLVNVI